MPKATIAAGALVFVLLATANSGGYRYGVADQAFYIPAIAYTLDPSLYPRDRMLLAGQMRLWVGNEALAWLARATGRDLPRLSILVYLLSLLILFGAALTFAHHLRWNRLTTVAFLCLLTLRHRITKTGANSLEGYMHPRTLAFALGFAAIAAAIRRRFVLATLLVVAAAILHPTTAAWCGVVVGVAAWWPHRGSWRWLAGTLATLAAGGTIAAVWLGSHFIRMDEQWLAVLGVKDYLFPSEWPLYAWALNLAYPVVITLLYRHRLRRDLAVPGEGAVVAGLVALVGVFLLSVPFSAAHVAIAVQLQVNRAFWVLDTVTLGYVAWWMVDRAGRRSARAAHAVVAFLAAFALGRGIYLMPKDAPLFTIDLPAGSWTNAMIWLSLRPSSWNVLADPSHAWRYGTSVRTAAFKDTLLEASKDTALAIYDRAVAMRVAEDTAALSNFETFTTADVRALAARDGLDVFVDRNTRRFDFPILYANADFVIYDLR